MILILVVSSNLALNILVIGVHYKLLWVVKPTDVQKNTTTHKKRIPFADNGGKYPQKLEMYHVSKGSSLNSRFLCRCLLFLGYCVFKPHPEVCPLIHQAFCILSRN